MLNVPGIVVVVSPFFSRVSSYDPRSLPYDKRAGGSTELLASSVA